MFFCMRCLMIFKLFLKCFLINSAVFSFREKMAGKRNFEYLPRQNVFFQGARLRRRRGGGEAKSRKTLKNYIKTCCKNLCFSYFFRSDRPNRKKASKMTSRRLSGTLPGSLREGKIDQLFAPRAPTRPRRNLFFAPGGLQRRFWRLPGGQNKVSMLRSVLVGPPGGLREPFWSHFG